MVSKFSKQFIIKIPGGYFFKGKTGGGFIELKTVQDAVKAKKFAFDFYSQEAIQKLMDRFNIRYYELITIDEMEEYIDVNTPLDKYQ